jgi:hypothetical protein
LIGGGVQVLTAPSEPLLIDQLYDLFEAAQPCMQVAYQDQDTYKYIRLRFSAFQALKPAAAQGGPHHKQ